MYHWNVGTWRVWVSLGWISPGDFLPPPTTSLGGLYRIHGNGIHKHRIIDSYWLHTCHDHHRNAWKGCLGITFCADDEACHCVKNGLISPQISSFPCNRFLTHFVWLIPLVNIYICGWIQSFKRLIGHLLGCQRRRLAFNLLVWDSMDLPTLRM